MKRIITLLCIVFSLAEGYTQEVMKLPYRYNIYPHKDEFKMPATPSAASFLKYGDYSPSNHKGITDLTIPLYTIKAGSLTFPISLSYNFGGIKVDDIASVAGLGWTISTSGAINRTINHKPDDWYPHSAYIPSAEQLRGAASIPWGNQGWATPKEHLLRAIQIVREEIEAEGESSYIVDSYTDQERDLYQYSVNGLSGSFIIDLGGKVIQFPYTDNKIILLSGTDHKAGFIIVSPEGTKYFFTKQIVSSIKPHTLTDMGNRQFPIQTARITHEGTTAYLLEKIVDCNNIDSIQFVYQSGATIRDHSVSQSYSVKLPVAGVGADVHTISNAVTSRTSTEYVLKKINFKEGYLDFDYINDRTDILSMRLTAITVYNNSTRINKVYFDNRDRFNGKRLKLSGVTISGAIDSDIVDSYGFDYYNDYFMPDYYDEFTRPNTSSYPSYYSQDEAGYYNGRINKSLLGYLPSNYFTNQYKADRSYSFTHARTYSLKQVTYPTGGVTEFIYDAYPGDKARIPALRISEIRSKNSVDDTEYLSRKKYYYSNLYDHSDARYDLIGKVYSTLNLNESFTVPVTIPGGKCQHDQYVPLYTEVCYHKDEFTIECKTVITYYLQKMPTEVPIAFPESNNFGERVYYSNPLVRNYQCYFNHSYGKVEEDLISKDGSIIKNEFEYSNKSTLYENTIKDCNRIAGTMDKSFLDPNWTNLSQFLASNYTRTNLEECIPYGYVIDTGWKDGNLIKQTTYKQVNGEFKKIKEITNTYEMFEVNDKVRVGTFVQGLLPEQIIPPIDRCQQNIGPYPADRYRLYKTTPSIYDFHFYNIYMSTGWKKLATTTVNNYEENSDLSSYPISENFQYGAISAGDNSHSFVTTKRENYYNAGTVRYDYKYPRDFKGESIYDKMLTQHLISPVIEVVKQEGSYLAKENAVYGETIAGIKPIAYKLSATKGTETQNKEIKILSYDLSGNPIQILLDDGLSVVYIWENSNMLAEIKNAELSIVRTLINGRGELNQYNAGIGVSEATIAYLRTSLPSAHITSFTYKPLVGITSITGADGVKINYNYDGTGKLSNIIDWKNNPLQKFEYKFRTK